jgi:hypothetical protein
MTSGEFAVAATLRALASQEGKAGHWQGSASELLERMTALALDVERARPDWPLSGRALARQLRAQESLFDELGIRLDFGRRTHGGKRLVGVTIVGWRSWFETPTPTARDGHSNSGTQRGPTPPAAGREDTQSPGSMPTDDGDAGRQDYLDLGVLVGIDRDPADDISF